MGFLNVLVYASLVVAASCYYVPGTYPREFAVGDVIEAHVNSLTSSETELPFDYYSMPFCKPAGGVKRVSDSANLGTLLQGVRVETSPYNFTVKVEEKVKLACPGGFFGPLSKKDVKKLQEKIDQDYRVNMILDNLPVVNYNLEDTVGFVHPGFFLGGKDQQKKKYYINNHLVFRVLVHPSHGEYRAAREKLNNNLAMESLDVRKLLQDKVEAKKDEQKPEEKKEEQKPEVKEEVKKEEPKVEKKEEPKEENKEEPKVEKKEEPKAEAKEEPKPAAAAVDAKTPMGPLSLFMIVGFEVTPCSIKREAGAPLEDVLCDGNQAMQEVKAGEKIVYTYDVYWDISSHKWASRWDAYLKMPGGKVHWFSIMNSMLVVVVMAIICAMILIRTIRRDLSHYEQLVVDGNSLDLKDEAGWKLVAGDVFRAPSNSLSLAVQVGSGIQIICTATVTLLLATLGFLSPASRGALITTLVIMYVLLAVPAGTGAAYTHAIMDRTFDAWSAVAWRTSLYFSGFTFTLFTVLNIVIYHTGSTGAVPFSLYLSIMLIWFVVSVPLTFLGAYLATKLPLIHWPVKTNQIPRHIPPPPAAAHPWLLFAAAGILPFGTLFIELYFIMTSVWLGFFYYLFGFVFLISLLTTLISAEIAILTTYVQLCAEDYLWWWRSFQRGGSVAAYIGLYSLIFLTTLPKLSGFVPVFIYLSYMSITAFAIYLAMGTVGFVSSLWFVYTIFKAVKQD